MTVSIMRVARTLGNLSRWSLSNLELQKIAFIAEMLYLGRTKEPLVNEDWQAWAYGPVQPELYHQAKIFGADPVRDIFVADLLDINSAEGQATNDAYNLMKVLTPGQMVNITHRPDGAWARNYASGMRGKLIPKSDIRAEYATLINDKQ